MHSVLISLVAFTAAAAVLTVTPGLDTALVLRTATGDGPKAALWSSVGIVTGCLVWASAVAVGLGALLLASRVAYDALRWVGAAYLFYVGLKLLLRPRGKFDLVATPQGRGGHAFIRGALTNLLNPKVGIFYVTFLPQFVPEGVSFVPFTILLGAIHAFLGLAWLGMLIAATSAIGAWLRDARVVRALDRLTGGVFIAFGIRLAMDSRSG